MNFFLNFEPDHCSMSGSNHCFLTWIQIFQEASQVVWYSHLFKNFPQFSVIHIVKVFSIVNEAEVFFFFLEFSWFSMIQQMLAVWSLVPLPFWIQVEHLEVHGSCTVEVWLEEFWALLCYCVRYVQLCCSFNILWHCLSWDWNENWHFPVLWPLLSFWNSQAYWVKHFYSIIF